MSGEEDELPIPQAANAVAEELDADVLFYSGPIGPPFDRRFTALCRKRKKKRKNVVLILVTLGGDADSAYRIARCLQIKYERFILFATGYCKSAGTLIALGAHEIVFADDGELGPLDVQMFKEDSLWETRSGLAVNAALTALHNRAYLAWETFFLETEARSQGAITVKTAAEIATSLTVGLFAPLYSQIDPLHVGEAARAMQIASHYGVRLMPCSGNYDAESLTHLITHYPAHGFVIDQDDASTVFEKVRDPSDRETDLAEALGDAGIEPADVPQIRYLSVEQSDEPPETPEERSLPEELALKPPQILAVKE